MAPADYQGLNVASGTHYAPGWLNFDLLPQDQLDLRASIFDLPFPSSSFSRVYLGHVLEHLEWHSVPAALTEVRRVTRDRGTVMVVGPCIERAVKTTQPQWLLDAIVADPPGTGPGGHAWTATEHLTVLAIQAAGLPAQAVPVASVDRPEWPNPSTAAWQCAVRIDL